MLNYSYLNLVDTCNDNYWLKSPQTQTRSPNYRLAQIPVTANKKANLLVQINPPPPQKKKKKKK